MTWLLPQDLAAKIQVDVRTIQRWCSRRTIPHVRIGRAIRFTPEQVKEIEDAYSVKPRVQINVDAPNPGHTDRAVVIPMQRSSSAAGR